MNIALGVTGSRSGLTAYQKDMFNKWVHLLEPVEFNHGDCVGVDEDTHDIIFNDYKSINIYVHPPSESRNRAYCENAFHTTLPMSYRARNQEIVDASDILLAFPSDLEERQPRSGTWMTVRMARKIDMLCVVIL